MLARLLCPLDGLPQQQDREGKARWWRADGWRVFAPGDPGFAAGEQLASFITDEGERAVASWDGERLLLPFDLEQAAWLLVSEAWRASSRSPMLSPGQLDFFYRVKRFIPRSVQLALRRGLIRRQGAPEFPRWPFDPTLAELLRLYVLCIARVGGLDLVPFRWFWPDRARGALILTHDVESAEGLRLAVDLADLEEERGFRSSFNVVADWYPVDHGILRELRLRGFEIGVHGIHHDRSLFASRESFNSQLPALAEAAAKFAAVGFRSPATHRVIDWLPELPFEYDCTIPHSDPYEPVPGGSCSVWPFAVGELLELPYTLPQDHTILTLLGRKDISLWLQQVDEIVRHAGLVQSVTHPDRGYLGDDDKRQFFVDFLDRMRERNDLWHALPRDVAAWWRRRQAGDGVRATWPAGAALRDVPTPPASGCASASAVSR